VFREQLLEIHEPLQTIRNLKGNSFLLPIYAAVIAGVRRSMDDWVPVHNLNAYRDFLHSLGLTVLEDCIFQPLSVNDRLSGSQYSPTTRARGISLKNVPNAVTNMTVHVFIAKNKQSAEAAIHAGWYSVGISGDRLLLCPKIDSRRLGHAFGYPECCVEAFLALNEWSTHSHLSEVFKRSESLSWKANCLAMRTPLTAICHIPCRYDCPRTMELTTAVLDSVRHFDPDFALRIQKYISGTFLVLNESACFKLRDARWTDSKFIEFSCVDELCNTSPTTSTHAQRIKDLIFNAQAIALEDGMIVASSNNENQWYEPSIHAEWFEDPFIGNFI
jgi:hypothetical protein